LGWPVGDLVAECFDLVGETAGVYLGAATLDARRVPGTARACRSRGRRRREWSARHFHRGFIGLVNLLFGARDRHREMRDRRARTAISGAVIGEFVAESVIFAGVGEVVGLVLGNGAILATRAVLPDLWGAIGPG
jgi:hypothetical protein